MVMWLTLLASSGCQSRAERALQDGHSHAQKNRWEDAKAAYQRAAAEDPKGAHAHALSGLALMKLGQADSAFLAFEKALAIDPTDALAREGLADLALEQHDAGAALEWLGTTQSARASILKARAQLERGADAEAALTHARSALTIDPASTQARYLEGSAMLTLGRYAEAQASFEALERSDKTSFYAPYGLARLAAVQRRQTDALLHLKAAKAAARSNWQAQRVAADPAFAFLVGSPAFAEVVGP